MIRRWVEVFEADDADLDVWWQVNESLREHLKVLTVHP